jgi:Leucine-rich repeat (LRR) protein
LTALKNSLLIIVLLIVNFGLTSAQASDYFQDVPVWTDLKEALKTPKAIRRLDLSKTKLKKIPAEVFELYNLEELMLSKNQITEIPADIKKLKKLRVLDISKNKLEELPKEIGTLKNLEKLDLGRNNIFSLPDEIGNCESLEILSIWDNNIGMLPEAMKKIQNLKQIDMRNIMISDPAQAMMEDMLPGVKILFTSNCNCGPNL